jgi:cytochrome b
VLALLVWLALQVGTGLVADDEIANSGPLSRFVAIATAATATSWHKTGGQWGLIVLVSLHVAAIVYYLWRKRINLVRPMLSGDKSLPVDTPPSRDDAITRSAAMALAAACAALVALVVTLAT